MVKTLADHFAETRGAAIQYLGRQLHKSLELAVRTGDSLELRFVRSTESPVQGVGLKCKHCRVGIAGTAAANVALWRDTAPDCVTVNVLNAKNAAQVVLFNQWRDEKHGSTMYHLNNAAIEILKQADGSLLLRCSDGWGAPNFEDLVLEVRVSEARQ